MQKLIPHPKSLWWLSIIYALFMFCFANILAVITLFIYQHLGLPQKKAYEIFAVYAALIFTLPMFGGHLASKFGLLRGAAIGLIFCLLGMVVLVLHPKSMTSLAMALFVIGNGFFTPALWCLIDHCYAKTDSRRESGFTWFYLLLNLGAVSGIFIGGYIGQHTSYRVEFLFDLVALLWALTLFAYKANELDIHPQRSISAQLAYHPHKLTLSVIVIAAIATPIIREFFQHTAINNSVLYILIVLAIALLVLLANRQKQHHARIKVYGFIILGSFSITFWTLYNLEPSLLSIYIRHNVDNQIAGISVPASNFFGFEGMFIIVNGIILSQLWRYLAARKKDIPLAIKFALSLILIGSGYVYLYLIMHWVGLDHKLPMLLMILCYFFFAAGELFIAPIGISMVGRLSPVGYEGLLMGIWQLFQGFAAVISGHLASLTATPKPGDITLTNPIYANMFVKVGLSAAIMGMVMLILSRWVKKLL